MFEKSAVKLRVDVAENAKNLLNDRLVKRGIDEMGFDESIQVCGEFARDYEKSISMISLILSNYFAGASLIAIALMIFGGVMNNATAGGVGVLLLGASLLYIVPFLLKNGRVTKRLLDNAEKQILDKRNAAH